MMGLMRERMAGSILHYMVGILPLYLSPLLIASFAAKPELAVSVDMVVGLSVLVSSLATVIAPLALERLSVRGSAQGAAVLALCGATSLALGWSGWVSIVGLGALCVGAGVMVAAAIKHEAAQPDADARLGWLSGAGTALVAAWLWLAAAAGADRDDLYLYGSIALFLGAGVALAPGQGKWKSGDAQTREKLQKTAVLLAAAAALLYLLTAGIYTYVGQFAARNGLSQSLLGYAAAACVGAEVIGAVACGWAARFASPLGLQALGIAIVSLASWAALYCQQDWQLIVCLAAYGFGFLWAMVATLLVAKALDPHGSLPSFAQGVVNLTYAGGIPIFAFLAANQGLVLAVNFQIASSVAGFVLLALLLFHHARSVSANNDEGNLI